MTEKTIYKVIKMRYAPRYKYGPGYRNRTFDGWYVDKQETVYRERKADISLAVNHAIRANKQADRTREVHPDLYPHYYRVEVTEVSVVEVAKGPRVYPEVADQ